ncbi:hypothetical protein [Marinoscillum pacificum]|uniref:hypothetical protein n=1 Tax=Marinoscillum pacificum TaxID=392723 RepID=UPI0021579D4C|nr:hypothetical protein [Marinoscillum pacificum]
MSRKIEWNPDHTSSDDQQNVFIDDYLTWSGQKKWNYLMEIISQGLKTSPSLKGKRRIEWNPDNLH